jgi:hypothetical protein
MNVASSDPRPGKLFCASVAAVIFLAFSAGCSTGANAAEKRGATLASETEREIQLLHQQSGDAYTCAQDGGTFDSCPAWDGTAKRALRVGQDLRLASTSGRLTKTCADAAAALGSSLIDWHDSAITWKTTGQPSSLPPRGSGEGFFYSSSRLLKACGVPS